MSTTRERPTVTHGTTLTAHHLAPLALAFLRVSIGFSFLWAFFDKLFGLGYGTPSEKSWLNGGSPTKGFLSSSEGPFAGLWTSVAGAGWANVGFMLGLLALGIALILGITNRLATIGGVAMFLLMWTVVLPPVNNPIIDDHFIQAAAVLALGALGAHRYYGLGATWDALPVVQRFPILK